VVSAVVLKPLPYDHPEKLFQLWMRFTGIGIPNNQNWVSAPEFRDLQRNNSFSQIAAILPRSYSINYPNGAPEQVDAASVSPSFFPLLTVQAKVGRAFLPEEDESGRDGVVLLSEGLWKRRFGADPSVAGRMLTMNGRNYTVVGVLPGWFQFPRDVEVWTPLSFSPEDLSERNRGSHSMQVIARIRPELSAAQARSDMAAVSTRIVEQHPAYNYRNFNFTVLMVPLLEQEIGDIKLALWLLMGAVGLVLLKSRCAKPSELVVAACFANS
jgi:putative ABC transport system permease protein